LPEHPEPQKTPLVFYRTAAGSEPVREWLKGLDEMERQAIGRDLPTKRTARVSRATPDEDLAIARRRRKELER
jgi:hypothetical protein